MRLNRQLLAWFTRTVKPANVENMLDQKSQDAAKASKKIDSKIGGLFGGAKKAEAGMKEVYTGPKLKESHP